MPPSTMRNQYRSEQQYDHTAQAGQFAAGPCSGVMNLYNPSQAPCHSQPSGPSANEYENTSYAPMFCSCIFQDEIDDYNAPESPLEPTQDAYNTEYPNSYRGDHPANFSHRAEPSSSLVDDDVGDMTSRGEAPLKNTSSHHLKHGHEPPLEPWAAAISEMVLYFPTPARIGPITFTEATTGLSWSGTTYTTCNCGATTRWTDFMPLHRGLPPRNPAL